MDGKEVELKLAVSPEALVRLKRHPAVKEHQRGRAASSRLRSVYYDTPERTLSAAGITVRLRTAGRQYLQTVKTAGSRASGLFARHEWEAPVQTEQLDHALLRATGLEPLQDQAVLDALTPLFATSVNRTLYALHGEGWEVELGFDVGEIAAGDATEAICEVELELRQGNPAHLFALARRMADDVPMRLMAHSKSDRGHELAVAATPKAVKARPVSLHAEMSTAEAFQTIARNCLHHLLANERNLVDHDDPEAVHQMRVALRRLRSALGIFREQVESPRLDEIKAGMKWLLGALGPARDAEVFLAEIVDPVVERHAGQTALLALQEHWRQHRIHAQAVAREAVRDRRFTLLLLDMGAWIEEGIQELPTPLPAFADVTLSKLLRKMRKAGGKDLRQLDPHHLHQVRIKGKRLRYGCEFFAPLYRKAETKDFLAILSELQDVLGEINDIAVAGERLAGQQQRAEQAWAAGTVAGWHEARRPVLFKPAQKAWKALRKHKAFWRKSP